MESKDIQKIKKTAIKEIIQSIVFPTLSAFGFMAWVYALVMSGEFRIYIFPVSGILLFLLYLFSGPLPAGVLLGFLSIVGFVNAVVASDTWTRMIFFVETLWLWGTFFVLESYKNKYYINQSRIREEEESLDDRTIILEAKIVNNQKVTRNLSQRISNYQSLGKMIQTLGSTLQEDQISPLITDLASKFIGKGRWQIKKKSNDIFSEYINSNSIPLIINNLSRDNRFIAANADFSSMIAVPLELNKEYIGMLCGQSAEPDIFDESDLRLLSVLGGVASLALNNIKLYQKTQELAITDGLTGLYVHNYYKELLDEEIRRSRMHNLPLSVTILDVDFFKNVNDVYGHSAGDAILSQVASLLRRRFRETDIVSRYGGEEFAVIMLQTDVKEAYQVVEDIRKTIEAEKFFLPVESFKPVRVQITMSAGLAGLSKKISDKDELLDIADKMLYKAKNNGRNRVEYE